MTLSASNLLAVTTQQRFGIAVVVIILIGWGIYLLVQVSRGGETPGSEVELAPNRRPYFTDEAMEGPRLNNALTWSLVFVAVSAIGLPLYWLREPSRQEGAVAAFEDEAVHRGSVLFDLTDSPVPEGNIGHFGCANCHGTKGEGGSTRYAITDYLGRQRTVTWECPPLDTVFLRYDEEEVNRVITYGRPNTPMPAWGTEGGGPMNPQQVTDLMAFIKSIQLSDKEAQERSAKQAADAATAAGKSPLDGETLFNLNCARCHTKGWSYGEPEQAGAGAFGPNLRDGLTVRQFPNLEDMINFITQGSEFEKAYGVRGVGSGRMPGFGLNSNYNKGGMLTPEQIRAIVEYERTL